MGIVFTLVGLHLVMHGPVWSIVEKIDLTGSSSSYHRYMLIDNWVRHFGDWWFIGTKDNGSWGFDMWDLRTSTLHILFRRVCWPSPFSSRLSRRRFQDWESHGISPRAIVRSNGSSVSWRQSVFARHRIFGINYMDQMQFAWFALLAIISAAVLEVKGSEVPQVQETKQSYEIMLSSSWQLQEIKT